MHSRFGPVDATIDVSRLVLGGNEVACRREVMREVLKYLAEHPDSRDTVDGVRWWISPALDTEGNVNLEEALDEMERRGWLTATRTSLSKPIYGLSPELREFFLFLNRKDEEG